MILRSDLAIEAEGIDGCAGIDREEYLSGGVRVTKVRILDDGAGAALGKPKGRYVTAEGMEISSAYRDEREHICLIAEELRGLLPESVDNVLVVGLGNRDITPDALGPRSVGHILATRHIQGELKKNGLFSRMRSVSAVAAGVLGQTGIETAEFITGIVDRIRPTAVIAVDALASRSLSRLGRTVQLSDTGISPGSGIGNRRLTLNESTLGVPVIAVGVPTVVDAATLAYDILGLGDSGLADRQIETVMRGRSMFVTPKETDILTERAARLTGMAINCALQPDLDFETIVSLVS